MKKVIVLTVAFFAIFQLWGQDCEKLLEQGLYSFTQMTNTGSLNLDIRTYFYSNQFKSDLNSGKWGSSLTLPIENSPVTIGMNFSEQEMASFRNQISQANSLKIDQNFYRTIFVSSPNTSLYSAYNECISRMSNNSGLSQGATIETEDHLVITLVYKPVSAKDPMPIIKNFDVQPSGCVESGMLQVGEPLSDYSHIVVCKRIPEKDLILAIQTDRGALIIKVPSVDKVATGREIPIGTIISSSLNFDQFSFIVKNNEKSPGGIWTAAKSKWAPCDGRAILGSNLSGISSSPFTPDLRGKFLRGLNNFDPSMPPASVDPENRTFGSVQSGTSFSYNGAKTEPNVSSHAVVHSQGNGIAYLHNHDGIENRPINVAVYYYVKIN